MEAQLARDRDGDGLGDGYGDDLSDREMSGEEDVQETVKVAVGDEEGEEAWRNSEGERLKDFGVDEDVEFYDEQEEEDDDVPLGELLARKRAAAGAGAVN